MRRSRSEFVTDKAPVIRARSRDRTVPLMVMVECPESKTHQVSSAFGVEYARLHSFDMILESCLAPL